MKLASLLNNRFSEIESRRKLSAAKTADQAYKKNAKYYETLPNAAMDELVKLLSGKKEKEEHIDLENFIQNLKQEPQKNDALLNTVEKTQDLTLLVPELKIDQMSEFVKAPTETPTEMMLAHDISVSLLPETGLPEVMPVEVKDAKQMAKERLTEKAIATYEFQMSMAKNGFRVLQPMIYRTA